MPLETEHDLPNDLHNETIETFDPVQQQNKEVFTVDGGISEI